MPVPNITFVTPLPVPTNNPSADVQNMQNNNLAISNYVAVDHIPFNNLGSGYHNIITQPSNADPVTNAGYTQIYSQNTSSGNQNSFLWTGTGSKYLLNSVVAGQLLLVPNNVATTINGDVLLSPVSGYITIVTNTAFGNFNGQWAFMSSANFNPFVLPIHVSGGANFNISWSGGLLKFTQTTGAPISVSYMAVFALQS